MRKTMTTMMLKLLLLIMTIEAKNSEVCSSRRLVVLFVINNKGLVFFTAYKLSYVFCSVVFCSNV